MDFFAAATFLAGFSAAVFIFGAAFSAGFFTAFFAVAIDGFIINKHTYCEIEYPEDQDSNQTVYFIRYKDFMV